MTMNLYELNLRKLVVLELPSVVLKRSTQGTRAEPGDGEAGRQGAVDARIL